VCPDPDINGTRLVVSRGCAAIAAPIQQAGKIHVGVELGHRKNRGTSVPMQESEYRNSQYKTLVHNVSGKVFSLTETRTNSCAGAAASVVGRTSLNSRIVFFDVGQNRTEWLRFCCI